MDVLVIFLVVLQAAFCWDDLPLHVDCSAERSLSDVAIITLSSLVKRRSLSRVSTSSFSLSVTMFAKPVGDATAALSHCSLAVASLFIISLIKAASWQWSYFYAALIFCCASMISVPLLLNLAVVAMFARMMTAFTLFES